MISVFPVYVHNEMAIHVFVNGECITIGINGPIYTPRHNILRKSQWAEAQKMTRWQNFKKKHLKKSYLLLKGFVLGNGMPMLMGC